MKARPYADRFLTKTSAIFRPDCLREILESASDGQERKELFLALGLPPELGTNRTDTGLDELRRMLPRNRNGNTVEDVYGRILWLLERWSPCEPPDRPRWLRRIEEYPWPDDTDWLFNEALAEGLGVSAEDLRNPMTWGELATAIWRRGRTRLLPLPAFDGSGDPAEARGLMLELVQDNAKGAAKPLREDARIRDLIPCRRMRQAWYQMLVAFGSEIDLKPFRAWAVQAILRVWLYVWMVCVTGCCLGIGLVAWKVAGYLGVAIAVGAAVGMCLISRWRPGLALPFTWGFALLDSATVQGRILRKAIGHLTLGELLDRAEAVVRRSRGGASFPVPGGNRGNGGDRGQGG